MKKLLIKKQETRSQEPDYRLSHDPNDAPNYTHRVKICHSKYVGKIVCIEDDDRAHLTFLKQWAGVEIDINNQWSINNGTIGLELKIHKDGNHKMHYMIRLKIKQVEMILKTRLYCMGICDDRKRVLFHYQPLQVKQLYEFYLFKLDTDRYIKQKHLSPVGWTIE